MGYLSSSFDPALRQMGSSGHSVGPQGRIIAGGDFSNYRYALHSGIVQLNDYGYADALFQSGTGFNGGVRAFALQPDGQLIVGGAFTSYNGTVCGRITRLRTPPIGDCEGVAGGGALPGTACNDCDPTTFNDVYDVNCVCAGTTTTGPAYQAGSLDTTFDPGSGFTGGAGSMALQPDGKVIVSGAFTAFNGTTRNRIARINADGSLDAGYAVGTGFNDRTVDLALQPDGKVLVSGRFTSFNGVPRDLVVRLNVNGSLDASFNPGTDHNETSTNKLALQPNGKVLVGGGFLNFNGSDVYDLVRLNANGSYDPTHDIGLGFDFPSDLNGDPADMVIQPDGKVIVVGGFLWYDGLSPFDGTICRGIARLEPNGGLDNSFETGGSYNDPDDGFTGVPLVIALQPDGRILVGGDFTSYETVARNRIVPIEPGPVEVILIRCRFQ
ncbi:MAG: delta-60 repeat domain-containing protein [Flavobacteriales bacterium]|nr:delta-60 repeat domain-containing protein [Flavobacteriales bacterium]